MSGFAFVQIDDGDLEALKKIHKTAQDHQDEGPEHAGWQSRELSSAVARVEVLLEMFEASLKGA